MNRLVLGAHQAVFVAIDHHQHLPAATAAVHRRHQPAAHRQLVEPGAGQLVATGGGDQAVVGCVRGVAEHAVAIDQPHVIEAPDLNYETLEHLSNYVKKQLKLRIQDPNFMRTGKKSPQWNNGWEPPEMYYQLPDRRIIAVIRKTGVIEFDPAGVKL